MLVLYSVPNGVSIASPPALVAPPGAVWHTAQSPTAASRRRLALRWMPADVFNAQNEVVARVRKQIYVRRKPAKFPPINTLAAIALPDGSTNDHGN